MHKLKSECSRKSLFLGIILFGLLHGINPSQCWFVAVLYSIRKKRQIISSLISSGIIAGAHFLSSIVVVLAFIFVTSFVKIPIPQSYLNYAATIDLGVLAYIFWKEKSEDLTRTQHGHLHDNISISTKILNMNTNTGIKKVECIRIYIYMKKGLWPH